MKIELADIDDIEWDEFVLKSDFGGFMQSAAWSKVKKAEGWEPIRIAVKKHGEISAVAMLLLTDIDAESNMAYSPQGPILDWSQKEKASKLIRIMQQSISELTKTKKIKLWRVEPWALHIYTDWLEELNFHKSHVDMQPRHTALIPLNKSLEETLASFKPKTRYNIKLALKNNLKVKVGSTLSDFKIFFETYEKTINRKQIDSKDFAYFKSIQQHLGKQKNAFVINVSRDNHNIGSILLIRFGEKITYFFGGFDYEYRNLMAPYLCHYEAIKLGQKLNCVFYDLWGIANTDDSNHPWQTFTKFKEGFKPVKISLCGSFDCYFDY